MLRPCQEYGWRCPAPPIVPVIENTNLKNDYDVKPDYASGRVTCAVKSSVLHKKSESGSIKLKITIRPPLGSEQTREIWLGDSKSYAWGRHVEKGEVSITTFDSTGTASTIAHIDQSSERNPRWTEVKFEHLWDERGLKIRLNISSADGFMTSINIRGVSNAMNQEEDCWGQELLEAFGNVELSLMREKISDMSRGLAKFTMPEKDILGTGEDFTMNVKRRDINDIIESPIEGAIYQVCEIGKWGFGYLRKSLVSISRNPIDTELLPTAEGKKWDLVEIQTSKESHLHIATLDLLRDELVGKVPENSKPVTWQLKGVYEPRIVRTPDFIEAAYGEFPGEKGSRREDDFDWEITENGDWGSRLHYSDDY